MPRRLLCQTTHPGLCAHYLYRDEQSQAVRMVESRWKLARIQRMEVALLQQLTPGSEIPATPGGLDAYASLQRYAAAVERSYYKALHELASKRAPATPQPSPQPIARPVAQPAKPAIPNEPNPAPAPRDITFSGKPATPGNLALRL